MLMYLGTLYFRHVFVLQFLLVPIFLSYILPLYTVNHGIKYKNSIFFSYWLAWEEELGQFLVHQALTYIAPNGMGNQQPSKAQKVLAEKLKPNFGALQFICLAYPISLFTLVVGFLDY